MLMHQIRTKVGKGDDVTYRHMRLNSLRLDDDVIRRMYSLTNGTQQLAKGNHLTDVVKRGSCGKYAP